MSYLGEAVINTAENVKQIQTDFHNFTALNSIFIVIASAVCVGIITKDTISDIMNEAILPLLLYWGKRSLSYLLYTKALEKTMSYPSVYIVLTKLGKLVWIIIVWIIVLFIVYIIFRKLIKIDLISSKVNLVQDMTKYVIGQENRRKIVPSETYNVPSYII